MTPVFDGHNDTLLHLHLPERGDGRSFFEHSGIGHLDLPRARKGGFAGGMFAVFVPAESEEHRAQVDRDVARREALQMAARLHRIEAASDGDVRVARTASDIEECLDDGVLPAVLHFEGAAPIDPELRDIEFFYAAGLRSIGLVWSRPNAFGHGVPFEHPHSPDIGPELTDAGKDLVDACNQLGIVVDLAHLNEAGFWDVADRTEHPLVFTHGGAHAVSPTSRNLTDDQLDAVAASNGVVGVTFAVAQIRPDGDNDPDTPLSVIADHVEYIADRIGVNHVAFGSDFDGATIPDELGDVTGLQALVEELDDRRFSEQDIEKIARGNWLRVLRETWGE